MYPSVVFFLGELSCQLEKGVGDWTSCVTPIVGVGGDGTRRKMIPGKIRPRASVRERDPRVWYTERRPVSWICGDPADLFCAATHYGNHDKAGILSYQLDASDAAIR